MSVGRLIAIIAPAFVAWVAAAAAPQIPQGRIYVLHSKAAGGCPSLDWHIVVEANDIRRARVKVFDTIVKSLESVLARRQALPAGVSRTAAAAAATKTARAQRAAHDSELARAEEKKTVGTASKPKAEAAHA